MLFEQVVSTKWCKGNGPTSCTGNRLCWRMRSDVKRKARLKQATKNAVFPFIISPPLRSARRRRCPGFAASRPVGSGERARDRFARGAIWEIVLHAHKTYQESNTDGGLVLWSKKLKTHRIIILCHIEGIIVIVKVGNKFRFSFTEPRIHLLLTCQNLQMQSTKCWSDGLGYAWLEKFQCNNFSLVLRIAACIHCYGSATDCKELRLRVSV